MKKLLRLLSLNDRARRRAQHTQTLCPIGCEAADEGVPVPAKELSRECWSSPCPSLGARWTCVRLYALAQRLTEVRK